MSQSSNNSSEAKWLPNVGDLLFVGVVHLLLFMRPNYLYSDGSTGWHIVSGLHILKTGLIPHSDIMSYTFAGKPWVAYEWLSDYFMACLVKVGGLSMLAAFWAISLASLVLLLYQRMRSFGCHFAPAMFFSIIGLIASASHWLVRPHLFTFFGVFLFYTKLEDYYRGKLTGRALFLWLLPCMVIWVNTHPAFLLAYAISALYFCVTACGAVFGRRTGGRPVLVLAVLLLALILVSFVNPYGVTLYHYIADYLKGTAILAVTDEFKIPDFKHSIHAVFLEILFGSILVGAYLRGRLTATTTAMVLAFGHLALNAVRNISLFAIVALPALGSLFGSAVFSPAKDSWLGRLYERMRSATAEFNKQEALSKYHILPLVYSLIIFAGAGFGGFVKSDFDAEVQPSTTLQYIREHKLSRAKGFNLDNWGGLLRYKLDQPVFIDDRADFYGADFYNRYGLICETRNGWRPVFDQYNFDWVLFPKDSALVQELRKDPLWREACQDQAAVLLVRTSLF